MAREWTDFFAYVYDVYTETVLVVGVELTYNSAIVTRMSVYRDDGEPLYLLRRILLDLENEIIHHRGHYFILETSVQMPQIYTNSSFQKNMRGRTAPHQTSARQERSILHSPITTSHYPYSAQLPNDPSTIAN